jgi:uncharacterized membrane protein (DUF373 family)
MVSRIPPGPGWAFGALPVGYIEDRGLRYAGKVGTGYDMATLHALRRRLDELEQDGSPFLGLRRDMPESEVVRDRAREVRKRHHDGADSSGAARGSVIPVRSREVGADKRREVAADDAPLEAVTALERVGEWIEIAIYVAGGIFLVAAAVIVLVDAVPALWRGPSPSARASLILDRVLLVFVLVEVLHTVRFVVTRHHLQAEPFLIVALIAGVRRVLVLTAGTQPLARHDDLVELGLLIALLVAASGALFLLRSRAR